MIEGRAFNGCTALTSFVLPDGLTTVGEYFLQKTEGKTNKRMIVTYPVQLQYVYNGITLASETYAYNYELPESIALSVLSAEWYADEACAQVLTAQTVLSALSANSENANLIDGNGVITLYAKDVEGEIFVGKPGLVYDGNSYSGVGVNALLTDDSMEIDDTMTVTVVSYTDALGNVGGEGASGRSESGENPRAQRGVTQTCGTYARRKRTRGGSGGDCGRKRVTYFFEKK